MFPEAHAPLSLTNPCIPVHVLIDLVALHTLFELSLQIPHTTPTAPVMGTQTNIPEKIQGSLTVARLKSVGLPKDPRRHWKLNPETTRYNVDS